MDLLQILEKGVDWFFARMPRKKPSQEATGNARFIAHRGAHDRNKTIIENTDAAFARALELGCWGIEFDVQETADHVLVVNHDPTLKRLWRKNVVIKELTFAAVHKLVPEVPCLTEVVNNYGKRMHLFIELKSPLTAEIHLVEALKGLIPCEDYHLLSLDESIFASLTHFPKAAMLLVASSNNVKKFCQLSVEKHYGGVLGHYLLLSKRKIKQLQEMKQAVGVGFVDSRFGLYRELNRGVYWIFSNNVEELNRCLEK
ncbi:glycerophosphoryl diester phosphodiesterase [Legionella lansingensis]|uniref:Glycerophosphoryl diester phosphodiesterase n=1 Tax=Legionella lansingensis TaxID=45067 RepID=A0A0W0VGC1_9GAMM|nr:glycerophosphodiester phosphodiesterase family protein [Legionella lansingensis]KTD18697.1 glycerophosphoryl diester phosphodiesterase [Legionella lansingensis]SNV57401.1 glycerophosphoryl diester phosphodiesterase [Legionella lansingensis]